LLKFLRALLFCVFVGVFLIHSNIQKNDRF